MICSNLLHAGQLQAWLSRGVSNTVGATIYLCPRPLLLHLEPQLELPCLLLAQDQQYSQPPSPEAAPYFCQAVGVPSVASEPRCSHGHRVQEESRR